MSHSSCILYEASKKGINMGDFFNVDNKFFQGLGKIIDVIEQYYPLVTLIIA